MFGIFSNRLRVFYYQSLFTFFLALEIIRLPKEMSLPCFSLAFRVSGFERSRYVVLLRSCLHFLWTLACVPFFFSPCCCMCARFCYAMRLLVRFPLRSCVCIVQCNAHWFPHELALPSLCLSSCFLTHSFTTFSHSFPMSSPMRSLVRFLVGSFVRSPMGSLVRFPIGSIVHFPIVSLVRFSIVSLVRFFMASFERFPDAFSKRFPFVPLCFTSSIPLNIPRVSPYHSLIPFLMLLQCIPLYFQFHVFPAIAMAAAFDARFLVGSSVFPVSSTILYITSYVSFCFRLCVCPVNRFYLMAFLNMQNKILSNIQPS